MATIKQSEHRFYRKIIAPLLYRLEPERAHELARALGRSAVAFPGVGALLESGFSYSHELLETEVCGIRFPNPVGMAAGFDKQGDLYPFLSRMGFGFVECGTFTAREQPGNEKPRVFRYPEHDVLVNRMGFNNPGADRAGAKIKHQSWRVPRGINIGKSKVTPLEEAADDYLHSLERLRAYADYIAVNVSSPNTPELRKLQERGRLTDLLQKIQTKLVIESGPRAGKRLPLLVKLAPDLSDTEMDEVLTVASDLKLDGLILANTTLDRTSVPESSDQAGGLSGPPLRTRSNEMISRAYRGMGSDFPIIGVGGISNGADALAKIRAGASLVQVYTAYIYQGPGLPAAINRYLARYCEREGLSLDDLVGADVRDAV